MADSADWTTVNSADVSVKPGACMWVLLKLAFQLV